MAKLIGSTPNFLAYDDGSIAYNGVILAAEATRQMFGAAHTTNVGQVDADGRFQPSEYVAQLNTELEAITQYSHDILSPDGALANFVVSLSAALHSSHQSAPATPG